MACDDFNSRASPGNAVGVSVFVVQDIQRRNWWRGKWKLDHLAFDKNWKLPFVAGPTCEPNGNQENAVATARRFVFDGVDLVLTRDEPVAPNAQVGHHLGTGSNLSGKVTYQELSDTKRNYAARASC